MGLSNDLISQFAKITKDEPEEKKETTVYGTTVEHEGRLYVKLDGSDRLTPITTTADIKPEERVQVMIKNHTATVNGNLSSPSASKKDLDDAVDQITQVEILVADKISVDEILAEDGRFKYLQADELDAKYINVDDINADTGEFNYLKADNLEAKYIKVDDINADSGEFNYLKSDILDAKYIAADEIEATDGKFHYLQSDYLDAKYIDVDDINAENGDFNYLQAEKLEAKFIEVNDINADNGDFTHLRADHLDAKYISVDDINAENGDFNYLHADNLEAKYANIDFANINEAAIRKIFSDSGLIKDLIVGDGTITGELIGVTIKGDLIEANTLKADKLVIKGEDGLYYKLNIDALGETTVESDEKYQNGLDGSVIIAKSITADRVAVTDLVAFGATIGGFNITESSLYSGVKSTVDNTTRGIYQDREGQFAVGDANNFIKFFKDTDGQYKLDISASQIKMSSRGTTIEDELDNIRDETTTNLRIDSSRGTVFKNNAVSTVLSAVIYRGSQRITDIDALHAAMGSSAYLQWKWQKMDESTFGVISASDPRLSNNGFTFTIAPEDVDTKVTFMCELIV